MKKRKRKADLTQADQWGGRQAAAGAVVEAQADLSQSFSSISVSVSLFSLMRRANFFFFFLIFMRNRGANEMLLEGSGGEKEIKEVR